jgi:hypothetical protein
MFKPRDEWHCPVSGCTSVYATQPELGYGQRTFCCKFVLTASQQARSKASYIPSRSKDHIHAKWHRKCTTTSYSNSFCLDAASNAKFTYTKSTDSIGHLSDGGEDTVVPSIRPAERYIARNATLASQQSPDPTIRPSHPETIKYQAFLNTTQPAHLNGTYPLVGQPMISKKRSMYKALRDLNAWSSLDLETLQDVVSTSLKGITGSLASHGHSAVMAKLYSKFKHRVAVRYQHVPEEDGRLYPIFLTKVGELQASATSTDSGNSNIARFDNTHIPGGQAVFPPTQAVLNAIQTSTPPQTPIIPGAERDALLAFWSNITAEQQTTLFRELLRTSKDSEALKHEWDSYSSRSQKGRQRDGKGSFTVRQSVEHTQGATPIYTPPTDSGLDLNAMIEARIQQARLKRKCEEEVRSREASAKSMSAQEEKVIKRVKEEPIVLSP